MVKLFLNFVLFIFLYVDFSFAKTIVFLGDSLTEGYGIEKENAYPSIIAKKLDELFKGEHKIINSSISGSTSASAKQRLVFLLKSKPDILVLALGANDGLRGVDINATYKNLEETIKLANKNQLKVLLCGVRVPPNYGKNYSDQFEKLFVQLKEKHEIFFVPRILEGVAGRVDLNQEDGIHPNEKGHQIMAETIWGELRKML